MHAFGRASRGLLYYKTYVALLTGKCFLGGMALNLVSFQFSKMSIPPNILPTVSLLGPVSEEDRRGTWSMGKLSSFKLSMLRIDEVACATGTHLLVAARGGLIFHLFW